MIAPVLPGFEHLLDEGEYLWRGRIDQVASADVCER